ncbi:hypothetical protein DAPPUDRAFT_232350 [Daphnia pulex]|uniref:Uncharacterized protein n=1 Tax=Daphnia pulex TaxID=6669 RepID=E9FQQ3_DAPPU|nr:hypothetical protein DAPPUDRAFT_232350 [Daphnia pulex]|eukprot:EFX90331.1 hypothetical protein DAPPUDRAFT_232350 [Daphnia pulex]
MAYSITQKEPGPFYENTELHFSHPIQVLHQIVQNAWKPHLALLCCHQHVH